MSNFKVGQKVVCIKTPSIDEDEVALGCKGPVVNNMYAIRAIIFVKGEWCLVFEEIINPIIQWLDALAEIVFVQYNFRPLTYAFADEVESMIKEQIKEEYV